MFRIFWSVILIMAVIDSYFLLKYSDVINELNPIGKWLISIGGVPLFFHCKMIGTVATLIILLCLYYYKKEMATVISFVLGCLMTFVVLFQIFA